MKPIVDPKLFYYLGLVDKITSIITGLLIILSCAVIVLFLVIVLDKIFDETNGNNKSSMSTLRRWLTTSLITFVFATVVYVIIPTKQVLYQMIIASQVTPNNLHLVQHEASKLHDKVKQDVIDIIRAIKEDSKDAKH